jgi:hypothetical protein
VGVIANPGQNNNPAAMRQGYRFDFVWLGIKPEPGNGTFSRVSTDSIFSGGPFQGPVAPSRRGRISIAGGVSSMRSLLLALHPTRAERSRRSRILEGA